MGKAQTACLFYLIFCLLQKEIHCSAQNAQNSPAHKVGGIVQAERKADIRKRKPYRKQGRARPNGVRQERGCNHERRSDVTAWERFIKCFFLVERGNPCALFAVRAGAVDRIAQNGHEKQAQRRRAEYADKLFCGVVLKDCYADKHGVSDEKERRCKLVKKSDKAQQFFLAFQTLGIFFIDSHVIVFHKYSIP